MLAAVVGDVGIWFIKVPHKQVFDKWIPNATLPKDLLIIHYTIALTFCLRSKISLYLRGWGVWKTYLRKYIAQATES